MRVRGRIIDGKMHFQIRMTRHADAFQTATGDTLFPGTLNVDIGTAIECKPDFRIRGSDIGEPHQDLLFERCIVAGQGAYRIRPYLLATGGGGWGDHILEIACAVKLRPLLLGQEDEVDIEFERRDA